MLIQRTFILILRVLDVSSSSKNLFVVVENVRYKSYTPHGSHVYPQKTNR